MVSRAPFEVTGQGLSPLILLVEHVPAIAANLAAALRAGGLRVSEAATGFDTVERKAACRPDIIVLDMELPGIDCFDLAERLACDADCGLILLTPPDDEAARVEGLDRGADDCVVKPVQIRELAARVRALNRRLHRVGARRVQPPPAPLPPAAGPIILDPAHRCVIGSDGALMALSEAEFIALETLVDADGAPVSRDWLGQVALKRSLHADDRSVDQLVLKLRRKLNAVGAQDRTILSARRQGYVIPDPSQFRLAGAAKPSAEAKLVGA